MVEVLNVQVEMLPAGASSLLEPGGEVLKGPDGGTLAAAEPHGPLWRSATPATIIVGTLPSPAIRLGKPLAARVERDEELVTVWCEELAEMGYGPHLSAAVEDLQQTVVELFFMLRDERSRL